MKLKLTRTYLITLLSLSILTAYGQADKIEVSARGNAAYSHKTSNGFTSTDVEHRGTIVFNDTDTDVISISQGGFLKISQKTFGTRRTALLEGRSNGTVSRKFSVGNQEQSWEPEGAKWLADVLLDVIRSSGLGAESRVARFYRKGGVDAIMNEIDEINSDFVKSIYFTHAVRLDGLSVTNLNELIEEASSEISSDFELSGFFIKNSSVFLKNNSSVATLLNSTTEISSDFEHARVLKHYIKEHDLTNGQIKELLEASNEISSDFEHAGVLLALNNEMKLSPDMLEDFLQSVENISSDFEAARVLKAAIKEQEMTSTSISMIIEASNSLSSDFEQAGVLKTLIGLDLSRENLVSVAEATGNISSDFEKSGVLTSILNKNDFDDQDLSIIIEGSENISSDFEHARVLSLIAKQGQLSENSFIAITEATDEISSDFEKSRVLKTLIDENDLNKQKSMALLEAIGSISSNFEKAGIMIAMGPKIPDDDEVVDAFRETAKTISSDHDFGRVMRSVSF